HCRNPLGHGVHQSFTGCQWNPLPLLHDDITELADVIDLALLHLPFEDAPQMLNTCQCITFTLSFFSKAVVALEDPVTIPCGRSFCKVSINAFWHQKVIYSCPQCRKTFTPRPVLHSNSMLAGKLKNLEICFQPNNEEQSELKEKQMKFLQRIQETQKKVQELQQAVDTIKEKAELSRAEQLFEQEIADLQRRFTELEQLSQTSDHDHFLQ
ncbi:hypothetical protein QTP86_025953, partial [Hemibagrus guttatus]